MTDVATDVIATLLARGLTIAVAESLTGGLLVAELIRVPGASAAVNGGIVAYNTELKHTIVGVDADLLAEHGPVHPEVARQMASRIRVALAIGGVPADVGLSTTGVAGPGGQGGHAPGTVYIGVAVGDASTAFRLELGGDRQSVRSQTVDRSLEQLSAVLGSTGASRQESF